MVFIPKFTHIEAEATQICMEQMRPHIGKCDLVQCWGRCKDTNWYAIAVIDMTHLILNPKLCV